MSRKIIKFILPIKGTTENVTIEVDKEVAQMSVTLKNMFEDITEAELTVAIPIPNITEDVFREVMRYYAEVRARPDQVSKYTTGGTIDNFCDLDRRYSEEWRTRPEMLVDILSASMYLDMKRLMEVTMRTIAVIFRKIPTEDVCHTFGMRVPTLPQMSLFEAYHSK